MALFKNLYFDLSFLNPFKKKEILTNKPFDISKPPLPQKKFRELPSVSKRLIQVKEEVKQEKQFEKDEKKHELPNLVKKPVKEPPKINGENNVKAVQPLQPKQHLEQYPEQHPTQHLDSVMTNTNAQQNGFFSELYGHLAKEESYLHDKIPKTVIQRDMFNEMQAFWREKKSQLIKKNMKTAIKAALMKKIEQLQKLEVEWQRLQLEKEKLDDEIAHKEILIDNHVRDLKKSFKKLHLSLDTSPEHEFVLSNGFRLKNLQELADALRTMDYSVFENHVTTHKNDFANWVKDVMGLNDLADSMTTIKNREVMANLIENWYKTN